MPSSNKHVLPHSFCESGIQKWLLVHSPSWGYSQNVSWGYGHLKSLCRERMLPGWLIHMAVARRPQFLTPRIDLHTCIIPSPWVWDKPTDCFWWTEYGKTMACPGHYSVTEDCDFCLAGILSCLLSCLLWCHCLSCVILWRGPHDTELRKDSSQQFIRNWDLSSIGREELLLPASMWVS